MPAAAGSGPPTNERPGWETEALDEDSGGTSLRFESSSHAELGELFTPQGLAHVAVFHYERGWDDRGEAEFAASEEVRRAWRESGIAQTPTLAELERRRQPTYEPCGRGSCSGRCSRCIRADHVRRNLARYGMRDYPGQALAAFLTEPDEVEQ